MKSNNIITGFSALLLAVVFTSCSTSVDIAKRQHNNGYYIHFASKNKVTAPVKETVTAQDEQISAVSEVNTKPVTQVEETVVIAQEEKSIKVTEVYASTEVKPNVSTKKQLEKVAALTDVVMSDYINTEPGKVNFMQKKFNRKANGMSMRGDAPAIILILLCIFIPPLAVGIVDDWGTKFWFDILLTLLFYFPGMIYAFFVCFG